MIQKIKNIFLWLFTTILSLSVFTSANVYADQGVGVSPMNERIILNPGEAYKGSFKITNPSKNTERFAYSVSAMPFYVDENYDIFYQSQDNSNQIVDWTTIYNPVGVLEVNDVVEVYYSIEVPENAPAGGQYMAIMVQSDKANVDNGADNGGTAINLTQSIGIAHIVYAEIAGTSIHSGEITSLDMQGFLLSGNISGSATIKNTGNVHGVATYKLQVFPLFSNEEVYTNEEDPTTLTILPNRSRYNETTWSNTPPIGIFNVIYTVEFEGVTAQVKKMVIKCPIWLLFIIIFAIIAIIMYFFIRSKNRKNSKKRSQVAKSE